MAMSLWPRVFWPILHIRNETEAEHIASRTEINVTVLATDRDDGIGSTTASATSSTAQDRAPQTQGECTHAE